mmetsp:Transcript_88074/g.189033  ORF Transcript_88074/g.189033 Transcript_88074/m.189033 type:complete len:221 (-) Transcript_88074:446-1108(-)
MSAPCFSKRWFSSSCLCSSCSSRTLLYSFMASASFSLAALCAAMRNSWSLLFSSNTFLMAFFVCSFFFSNFRCSASISVMIFSTRFDSSSFFFCSSAALRLRSNSSCASRSFFSRMILFWRSSSRICSVSFHRSSSMREFWWYLRSSSVASSFFLFFSATCWSKSMRSFFCKADTPNFCLKASCSCKYDAYSSNLAQSKDSGTAVLLPLSTLIPAREATL